MSKNIIISIKRTFKDSDKLITWYITGWTNSEHNLNEPTWSTDIKKAFVCNSNNVALLKWINTSRYSGGESVAEDKVEWIYTDEEETRHESNGWKQEILWTKRGN